MEINLKNILIILIILCITASIFNGIYYVISDGYIRSVIKSESKTPLESITVYSNLTTVLQKYLDSLSKNEYSKLNDMTLYYAKKSNSEYDNLKSTLGISTSNIVEISKVYVLEKDIYRCIFSITADGTTKNNISAVIKLDSTKSYFRVLDISI